jgi:hypothetical protein
MITAKNKDVKWFKSLQADEDGRPKWVFVGVGPNGEFWARQNDVPYLGDDVWDRAEDAPQPLLLIQRGVVYIDVALAAKLTATVFMREAIETFVATMKGVLASERDSHQAIRFYEKS